MKHLEKLHKQLDDKASFFKRLKRTECT